MKLAFINYILDKEDEYKTHDKIEELQELMCEISEESEKVSPPKNKEEELYRNILYSLEAGIYYYIDDFVEKNAIGKPREITDIEGYIKKYGTKIRKIVKIGGEFYEQKYK